MAWATGQVTLLAGPTQLSPSIPGQQVLCRQILIQNNSANNMRLGDANVSATRGIQLNAAPGGGGGSFNSGATPIFNSYLSDFWLFGTQGDVVDFMFNT